MLAQDIIHVATLENIHGCTIWKEEENAAKTNNKSRV